MPEAIDSGSRYYTFTPMHSPPADIPANVIASTLNQRSEFGTAYSVLEEAIENRAFPGAAFGVLYEGKAVALDGVGCFTYEADSPVVTAATVYDLASVTKVVATAAAAMLLYDRRQLDLNELVGNVLPGFVIGGPCQEVLPVSSVPVPTIERCKVALRHLLAHSSGLPAYARLFEANATPSALLAACLGMPLETAPGARAEYSDIGFILLGKALEVLAGEPLDAFCSREIFAPLGLAATCYRPPPFWRAFIPPTVDDTAFRHRVIQGEVHDENCAVLGGVSGHAGVFSRALDLLGFASCILGGGKTPDGRQLFKPETIRLFAQRQGPPESSRALGWDTPSGDSSSGHHFTSNSIGHLGYTGTSLWIDLDRHLAVTLLTNRTWPDRSTQAIRTVRPAFHDAVLESVTLR